MFTERQQKELDNKLNTLKTMYDDDLLYVGLRGSFCIGLNDENSDIDLYAIVNDNHENSKPMQDVIVVNLDTFDKLFSDVHFETVEAIVNNVYINNKFYCKYCIYRSNLLFDNKRIKYLFWYQIWSMLKNQVKQYQKGDRKEKFASKSILYYKLLSDENIIDYWLQRKTISNELKQEYFDIKYGNVAIDDNLMETIWQWRTNNKNREKYRKIYDWYM